MKYTSLNGTWTMEGGTYCCEGKIPGSVYSFLLEKGLMADPFYRMNEFDALKLMENEFAFSRSFTYGKTPHRVTLCCEGLDTLCDLYLNGCHIGSSDNMHRTWQWDVTDLLLEGENQLRAVFHPIRPYMDAKANAITVRKPSKDCMTGFWFLRKAHCMMGWDWGPRLPDAGIWRNIRLEEWDSAKITELRIEQRHEAGKVFLTPRVETSAPATICVTLTAPDGQAVCLAPNAETEVTDPQLWWPNGLGDQPLYTVTAQVLVDGEIADAQSKRIGLRTLKLIREKDSYGESFCHEVNGIRFFAMGADYIPEDNILSRITRQRTEKLLRHCRNSHFNTIRVWGGGYYPDDFFFDLCDEQGLVVFQDMMVACTPLWVDAPFRENLKAEFTDNLRRIRHHACLAILCGNNEVEMHYWEKLTPQLRQMHLDLFDGLLPELVERICPEIPYITSSPTSCDHAIDPENEHYGDGHYWDVWHKDQPYTEFRNKYFRYLSEFGFQSFPCEKTVEAFTLPEDRNIFSRVMEMHQRNGSANSKILGYLAQTFLYPGEFGTLLYASQLLQAEAIRYGVEHFRRHRGRCMGALYWQLNDIWPVASWASIDYYGRFKALQYAAKRFFSPILISCKETGEKETRPVVTMDPAVHDFATKAQLCITNDTLQPVSGTVSWALRDAFGNVLQAGHQEVTAPPLCAHWLEEMDFCKTDVENTYFSFSFVVEGSVVSEGTALFTAPKHFLFRDPGLRWERQGNTITVHADAYAKYVEIDSPDSDFILSDNYFDMNGGSKTVTILEGEPKTLRLRSVYDIR